MQNSKTLNSMRGKESLSSSNSQLGSPLWGKKEPVKFRYLQQLKSGKRIPYHETKNWLFLRRGLDDFRDGFPPIGNTDKKIQATRGLMPPIFNDFLPIGQLKPPTGQKRLNRYQTYLSRSCPMQQVQRHYISTIEESLLQHPLALYPHLEGSVPPESRQTLAVYLKHWKPTNGVTGRNKKMYDTIMDILDPHFHVMDISEDDLNLFEKEEEEDAASHKTPHMTVDESRPKLDQYITFESNVRNLYRWAPQKTGAKESKKKQEKENEQMWRASQTEEEHIKQVTREFCEWVADLGGDTNNIEESTITSLFASGYDTKPALSVPIHVVDLASVPHELRVSAVVPPPPPPDIQTVLSDKPKHESVHHDDASFVKYRYGAWYLAPSTWKKRGYYEPLEDPKQLKEHEMSEAKKESLELTEALASMHAAKAFEEFITKKSVRKPEFLVEISEIQKRAIIEEEKRIQAELIAKQKKLLNKQSSMMKN